MKTRELQTVAAYARSRGLCPATVYKQIRQGKITRRPDGLIDPTQADRDRQERVRDRRGGVWLPRHGPQYTGAPPKAQEAETDSEIARRARVQVLESVSSPDSRLHFAALLLAVGCTAQQAYAGASMLSTLGNDLVTEADLQNGRYDWPTDQQWRALLGAGFDIEVGDELADRALAATVAKEGRR